MKTNNFSVEQYACNLFTSKYGSSLDTRFDKLFEEFAELKQAYKDYMNHRGKLDFILDELSDVEAVLAHIRCILSERTHEESVLEAVIKVRIREYDPMYKKESIKPEEHPKIIKQPIYSEEIEYTPF